MKHLFWMAFIVAVALVGCTKSNNTQPKEEAIEETVEDEMPRLILVECHPMGQTTFGGFILATQDGKDYYLYDDEANYDDSYFSVFMALKFGREIYGWCYELKKNPSITFDQIGQWAMLMEKMPLSMEIRNQYGITDEVYEVMAKCYYDYRDTEFYEPTRKYGITKYPYRYSSGIKSSFSIQRVTDFLKENFKYDLDPYPVGAIFVN